MTVLNEELSEMQKESTHKADSHRFDTLIEIKEKLERVLLKNEKHAPKKEEFIKHLYSNKSHNKWILSQYKSICNQIDKLVNENSNLTDEDKFRLSKELIFDISYLEELTELKIGVHDDVYRPNYLQSNQFFLHAKFSYFTDKHVLDITQRNFDFSCMPTLIRQSIEIKVKEMIGLEKITTKNGSFKMIGISRIIDFFIKNPNYFDIPVPFETLKAINEWTNGFVHTGIIPFCWQSLEAIDLIEPLFSIKNEKTEKLSFRGFSYLAQGISLTDLKNDLDKQLDANFILNAKYLNRHC